MNSSKLTNLTENDSISLSSSFIPPELTQNAGIYRVDSLAGANLIGRTPNIKTDYSGLVFPNFLPGQTAPREHCLRLDNPPLEQNPMELQK